MNACLYNYIRGHSKTTWTSGRGWVGGLKFGIFVHVQYIKNVHEGRWVVKKEQNYVHVVFE